MHRSLYGRGRTRCEYRQSFRKGEKGDPLLGPALIIFQRNGSRIFSLNLRDAPLTNPSYSCPESRQLDIHVQDGNRQYTSHFGLGSPESACSVLCWWIGKRKRKTKAELFVAVFNQASYSSSHADTWICMQLSHTAPEQLRKNYLKCSLSTRIWVGRCLWPEKWRLIILYSK